MENTTFDGWLEKTRIAEEKKINLPEALLSNSLYRYVFHRSYFFLGRLVMVLLLQSLELWFLAKAFSGHYLSAILVLKLVTVWISASWWGGIEPMRSEIRELVRDESTYRIPDVIRRWLTVSYVLAAPLLAASVVLFFLSAILSHSSGYFVVGTLLFRLATEIIVRTFHSGAYAIRRIYRPIWAVLLVELSGFGLFLFGAKFMPGPWAAGLSLIFSGIIGPLLNFIFIKRVYEHFNFWPLEMREHLRWTKWGFRKESADYKAGKHLSIKRLLLNSNFLRPGFAYSLVRLDSVIIVTALMFSARNGFVQWNLAFTFYLFSPLVISGHDWGQLLYFDFKKLELGLVKNLRESFDKALRPWPVILAGLIWALGVIAARTTIGFRALNPALSLGPLMITQGYLGYVQVRAYSSENYRDLFWVGIFQLCTLLAVTANFGPQGIYIGAPIIALISTLFLNFRYFSNHVNSERVLNLPNWIARLALKSTKEIRVGRFSLLDQENSWHAINLLKTMKTYFRKRGEVSIIRIDEGIWFEQSRAISDKESRDFVLKKGAGWIKNVRTQEFAAGSAQPSSLLQRPFFGQDLRRFMTKPFAGATPEQEFELIKKTYPRMIVVDLATQAEVPQKLRELSPKDRELVYLEALEFVRDLHLFRARGRAMFAAGWVRNNILTHVMFVPLDVQARQALGSLKERIIRLNYSEVWVEPEVETHETNELEKTNL